MKFSTPIFSSMIFFLAVLSGCASDAPINGDSGLSEDSEAPVVTRPTRPIVSIDATQLSQYWQIDDSPSMTEGNLSGRAVNYGCVALDFGIDAEGKVFDARVKKSWPQGAFVEFAKVTLSEYDFDAAETNAALQPVRTIWVLTFADVDGKKSLHKSTHIERYCQ